MSGNAGAGFMVVTRLACFWAALFCCGIEAGDYWAAPGSGGVIDGDDCGRVSDVSGQVRIRRVSMSEKEAPLELRLADRLHSGDEIEVLPEGRLEWNLGLNTVATAGSGSHVRLLGVRTLTGPEGPAVERLDIQIMRGEVRAQVRLNRTRPEALLVRLTGMDFLLSRGDAVFSAAGEWRASVLEGTLEMRGPRGGKPESAPAPRVVASGGLTGLSSSQGSELVMRLPFSFELARLALPPRPAPAGSGDLQGP